MSSRLPASCHAADALASGEAARCVQLCDEALARHPDDVAVLDLLGQALFQTGDLERSLAVELRLAQLQPGNLCYIRNVIVLLRRLDRGTELLPWADAGLALDCADATCLEAKAIALALDGDPDLAAAWWRRQIRVVGETPYSLGELGRCMLAANHCAGAADVLTRALALDDGSDIASRAGLRSARAEALLKAGQVRAGLADYGARVEWDCGYWALPGVPRWQGEPLAGKTLLVMHQLGYGDQIMLAPTLREWMAQGARVVLTCDGELRELLALWLPGAVVVTVPRPDRPALSPVPPALKAVLKATRPDFFTTVIELLGRRPLEEGRLRALPTGLPAPAARALAPLATELRRDAAGRPLVGLAWDCFQRHFHPVTRYREFGRRKSLPPLAAAWLVAQLPEVRFVSLHIAAHDEALGGGLAGVRGTGASLANFARTAELIAQLDAVVSVDTSVLHVGCQLGKPSWVLLNHEGDWRYGASGNNCALYPQLRILRQRVPGDWGAPLQAAVEQLRSSIPARAAAAL